MNTHSLKVTKGFDAAGRKVVVWSGDFDSHAAAFYFADNRFSRYMFSFEITPIAAAPQVGDLVCDGTERIIWVAADGSGYETERI